MLGFIPMNEMLTVFTNTGSISDTGELISQESEVIKCYIQYSDNIENITDSQGVQTLSDCAVTLGGKVAITVGDYVQTNDNFDQTLIRKVLSVDYLRDLSGAIAATKLRVGIGKGYQKPIYRVRPIVTTDTEGCQVHTYDYGDYLMLNIQPNITKAHHNVDGVNIAASMYAYCNFDTDILDLDALYVNTGVAEGKPDYYVAGIQTFDRYKVAYLSSLRR